MGQLVHLIKIVLLLMIIRLIFVQLSAFLGVSGLPLPDHCYDFTSPNVIDSCGSLHLSKQGMSLKCKMG